MNKFLSGFNIGHLIIVIGWLISAGWYSHSIQSKLENTDLRVTALERQFKENAAKLDAIQLAINNSNFSNNTTDVKLNNIERRVIILEDNATKIAGMANDIGWLKEYLIRNQDKLGEALLRVLNDKNNNTRP